jgi:hypothetical protein
MKTLGLLDLDRLGHIPVSYWPNHEFCFYLHDQMLELLIQYETSGAHRWVTNAFEEVIQKHGKEAEDIDIFEFLKEKELVNFYKHHLVCHLVFGLTGDMLNFLYESLRCFEKRKFAVAFSLLRKPLKENLLFLSWLLGNEEDFINRFEKNNYVTLKGLSPEQRQTIFTSAIAKLPTSEAFAADLLEGLLFSKTNARSFEPVWQRATHLITSQGASLRTEDLNINFIFQDVWNNDLYALLYEKLPYVMLYAIQVALECFARILPSNEHTTSHLILSSMGAYECLFERKRSVGVTKMLGRSLRSFITCIHCKKSIRLSRDNAVGMYLRETLECNNCGLASPLPLYWLFSQANIKIDRKSSTSSILAEFLKTTSNAEDRPT